MTRALLLLMNCMVCCTLHAQAQDLESRFASWIQALLDHDLISGSVLVASEGEILLANGFGDACREFGVPNDTSRCYRLGSMSKPFTALAILQLAERGQLRLDDSLEDYLPDFPHARQISIRQLLSHTSGVVNYNRLPEYEEYHVRPMSLEQMLDWIGREPLEFEPGSRFSYSNSGYLLLSAVIESLSGMSYAEYLQQNIFHPAGMHSSGVDEYTAVIHGRASGYGSDGNVYRAPYRYMPSTLGAGALYSSPADLLRWDSALRDGRLLSRAWQDSAAVEVSEGYGLGWFVSGTEEHRVVSHRGDINGFRCSITRSLDEEQTVIALLNYESTFALPFFHGLNALAAGHTPPPLLVEDATSLSTEDQAQLAGFWEWAPGKRLRTSIREGRLYLQQEAAPEHLAWQQAPGCFFVLEDNALLQFARSTGESVDLLLVTQGAHRIQARRVTDSTPSSETAQ